MFIHNPGLFNKGWAFNVGIKESKTHKLNYNYYLFADIDVIFPQISAYCDDLIEKCVKKPVPAFRMFEECLDTTQFDLQQCQKLKDVIDRHEKKTLKLKPRYGTTFA